MFKKICLRLLSLFLSVLLYTQLFAEVIVVDSNLDDPAVNPLASALTATGVITLRSALMRSNANGDSSNTIDFNIQGDGPFTINVGTGAGVIGQALPTIIKQTTINGYSQPGANVATSTTNAIIQIILNGLAVNIGVFQNGLTLDTGSDSSLIKGLVIEQFPGNGIEIVNGSSQRVLGNYIGVGQDGTTPVGNGKNGISISSTSSSVFIGSLNVADRNVIGGHQTTPGMVAVSGVGVYIEGNNNQVIGNFIGTDAFGTGSAPNRNGIYEVSMAVNVTPLNNIVKCNLIAFNNGAGVNEGYGVIIKHTNANSILSNSIFHNTESGILLLNGGNDSLIPPLLKSATASGSTIKVNGTFSSPAFPNSNFRIEFFVNPMNKNPITEGQTYVGQATVTTDGSGNAVFNNIRLPSNANPGQFVSATATLLTSTGMTSSTSPYSTNVQLTTGPTEGSLSVAIYLKYCNRDDKPCAASS